MAGTGRRRRSRGRTGRRDVLGDGLAGWPSGAPYDRIHSTAPVRSLPRWGTPYANAGLLRLVAGDRDVTGAGHGPRSPNRLGDGPRPRAGERGRSLRHRAARPRRTVRPHLGRRRPAGDLPHAALGRRGFVGVGGG
ncbi:hypothetical protein ACFXPE_00625 [Streptomyces scopuliridis]|uniref:hypothetical protein n=1 Tax=Streptomyces scopuliridis TaxID=452529 RepID=UPI0036930A16